jgi:hypothetical protein
MSLMEILLAMIVGFQFISWYNNSSIMKPVRRRLNYWYRRIFNV